MAGEPGFGNGGTGWDAVLGVEGERREERLRDLVRRMTLDEKIRQMAGNSGPIKLAIAMFRYNLLTFNSGLDKRLGIPDIRFTDGPRGVALNHSTCFPVAMARGATWDIDLEERVGEAMGVEARAQGANSFGGVCINLPRHPGWGRAQETFGDDPFHLGAMGAAAVKGLQGHVMACVKHFACNSIEEARFFVDVRVDERTLREIYLPHFRKCVQAGAAAVMSAYNRVNGEYCAHNRHLLRDILKGDWGFQGLVMSDFFLGTRDTVKAADGGLDIEMPNRWHFGRKLKRAVRGGRVPEEVVDEAVTRVLRQKARFAGVGDPSRYTRDIVACEDHAELALEAARKSMVLLKNEGGVLPLDRDEIAGIAVIGKLADRANLGDSGSSQVRPPYTVTPLQGIMNRRGSVEVTYQDGGDLSLAESAARRADAVVVVVGLTGRDEGEALPYVKIGGDRYDLRLRESDEMLIGAMSRANDRCIVVLEGGSAITMEGWRDSVPAILMAWYPGMEGGNALADVLFGEVNPGGKLPMIFPRSVDQLPFFDKKARSIDYGFHHGYRLFDARGLDPAFPFGFGLSYTEYRYSGLRLSDGHMGKDGAITAKVEVANVGGMAGDEIVQLYAGCDGPAVERPEKELKGFARVHLEPGESKTVSLVVEAEDLAYYDVDSGAWTVEENDYRIYVGPSSRREDLVLSGVFRVSGP
ncbi:MAG: glycoside hydrolase family 3 C-terminal domain-containing protein [Actinomycetota bacterium]|nr:glycoside hydrolase family 3 C-terminal domain-containing protein [Actinomycetota bacterium]